MIAEADIADPPAASRSSRVGVTSGANVLALFLGEERDGEDDDERGRGEEEETGTEEVWCSCNCGTEVVEDKDPIEEERE